MPLVLRAMLIALLACLEPAGGRPGERPVVSSRATASLVSDVDSVAPGRPFRVGLRLRLATGWHTYWQNPGDAGIPPELDFDLPAGATAGPIVWPTPQRVPEGSLMTYSYTDDVLLPVTVTPSPERRNQHQGACELAGVPRHLRAGGGRFPARSSRRGTARPSAQAPLFAAFDRRCRGRRPGTRWSAGTGRCSCRVPS